MIREIPAVNFNPRNRKYFEVLLVSTVLVNPRRFESCRITTGYFPPLLTCSTCTGFRRNG